MLCLFGIFTQDLDDLISWRKIHFRIRIQIRIDIIDQISKSLTSFDEVNWRWIDGVNYVAVWLHVHRMHVTAHVLLVKDVL